MAQRLTKWWSGISASLRQTTMKIPKKIRNSGRSLAACMALQLTGSWNGNSASTLMATLSPPVLPLKMPPRRLHREKSANRRSDPKKARAPSGKSRMMARWSADEAIPIDAWATDNSSPQGTTWKGIHGIDRRNVRDRSVRLLDKSRTSP